MPQHSPFELLAFCIKKVSGPVRHEFSACPIRLLSSWACAAAAAAPRIGHCFGGATTERDPAQLRSGGGGDEEIGFSFIEKVRERRRICRGSIGLEKIAHIVAKRIRQKGEGKIDRTFRTFPREEVALFSCSMTMMLALQAPSLILPDA